MSTGQLQSLNLAISDLVSLSVMATGLVREVEAGSTINAHHLGSLVRAMADQIEGVHIKADELLTAAIDAEPSTSASGAPEAA
ncbi:hypothetical protein [Ideonella oryzae]|uniref:Uncharacterized protein n=1 Tax=Ideonella oryzae TaxID=2937441 RepID=A0ABT1BKR0_9BURK|nr:hypothetical protein [Ideonella oryzae]MCO5976800.1 hypothetical protein [Ideonella oryzae]